MLHRRDVNQGSGDEYRAHQFDTRRSGMQRNRGLELFDMKITRALLASAVVALLTVSCSTSDAKVAELKDRVESLETELAASREELREKNSAVGRLQVEIDKLRFADAGAVVRKFPDRSALEAWTRENNFEHPDVYEWPWYIRSVDYQKKAIEDGWLLSVSILRAPMPGGHDMVVCSTTFEVGSYFEWPCGDVVPPKTPIEVPVRGQ